MHIMDSYSVMRGMEKYVLSGAVPGLTSVAFHEPEKGAYTDGSTIYLPRPAATLSDEGLLLWRYYAEHEMGHEDPVNSSPHWKEVMEQERKNPKYKDDSLLWNIANLISDHVQERNRIGVMIGRDDVLLRGRLAFMQGDLGNPAAKDSKMMGLGVWDWNGRKRWNKHIANAADIGAMSKWKEAGKWAKRFAETVDFDALKNEADVFQAALAIRKLFTEEEAAEFKRMEAEAGDEGSGMPCKLDDHGKMADIMEGRAKPKLGVPSGISKPDGERSGHYNSRVPLSAEKGKHPGGHSGSISGHRGEISKRLLKTNLPAKVRAHLLAMKVAKYRTGYRSGRLDTARLSDVLRGKDDVFRRKEEQRQVNTAVSLLVDASGSMSGSKYYNAAAASIMLAEALQGVGVNVEIAAFTEFGHGADKLIHEIVVPFGGRFARERALDSLAKMATILYENADGESILYAYSRLKRQQNEKKILVVLSDGSPSCGGSPGSTASITTFTQQVIKSIERDKGVELWAIGLDYDPRMYRNRIVLERTAELESKLLDLVKNFVKGE